MVQDYFMPLVIGGGFGALCALLKLPVPAPHALPGVVGILGVTLGYMFAKRFM